MLIREEMQSYLKEKRPGIATDSLSYWKSNCEKYPHLAKLARRYHSAPAGSAASERLFSSGRNVLELCRPSDILLRLVLEPEFPVSEARVACRALVRRTAGVWWCSSQRGSGAEPLAGGLGGRSPPEIF